MTSKRFAFQSQLFQRSYTELYISLETYGGSGEKPSTSQTHAEDDEPEGAPSKTPGQFPVKKVESDAIDATSDLHKFIGNLKITSVKKALEVS